MQLLERFDPARREGVPGYIVLIDPDKTGKDAAPQSARMCQDAGADMLFVGGSLLFSNDFDEWVRRVKAAVDIPVILFPGGGYQLSSHADGLLFLSLVSGRNAQFLVGEQVSAAPRVRAAGLDTVAVAYMLIESGTVTSVEFMSGTRPIPSSKPDIAAAHALAAGYLGFDLIYLEAGSGAAASVPDDVITAVTAVSSLPVIVGGGIRTPGEAAAKVRAGASFVVTGTALETERSAERVREFAIAVHGAAAQPS
ncbi:geranylgeranylglyceryl/heptaprenylglyceryl phosphate synthase [bacterium]|nr:geranylgeranylglyceryl/heptaprenylglyceryl phosphate synthase [bacterium]